MVEVTGSLPRLGHRETWFLSWWVTLQGMPPHGTHEARAERLRGAGRTSTTSRSSDLQVVPVLDPRAGGSRSAARLGASREARAQRDADKPRRFRPTAPERPTELVSPLTSHSPEKIPIELFILRFFIPFHFPTRSFPKMLFFFTEIFVQIKNM